MIAYEDGVAALEWLAKAFGFRELVLVYVADLDAHFAAAKAAGATILSEIEEDPPERRYRVEDLEGHCWFFMERNKG